MMKKEIAEFIGTFALVLFGCGAATIVGEQVGVLGVALTFGLTFMAMAYAIGAVSGCHINPAVSFGAWIAGRLSFLRFISYAIAQSLGAVAAAYALMTILQGQIAGYDVAASGLAQNGWGEGFLGEYTQQGALIFEIVASFIFVTVILGATDEKAHSALSGVAIGAILAAIYVVGYQITGGSVNPARSLGPAVFVGGQALEQLWLFVAAPMAGALIAALRYRFCPLSGVKACCGGCCHK